MNVNQRRACLEGFVRRLDLLLWRHRHGGIVFLARHCSGDGDGDDDRLRHAVKTFFLVRPRIIALRSCCVQRCQAVCNRMLARARTAETPLAHEQLTYEDLLRIVELIKSTEHFSEFRLKVGEIELELRRRRAAGGSVPGLPSGVTYGGESKPGPDEANATEAREQWPEDSVVIRSPMMGTFYRSPAPGAAPFVEVGQMVQPDTTVCIIEVMKLMNSIAAGAHGTVVQMLVEDASTIEEAQPLIVLQSRVVNDDPGRVA